MVFEDKHIGEIDLKVYKEFAKVGYTPLTLRQSFNSLQTIHEFLQFIGTNQYYSDAVNKRIFLLTLDADYAVIATEELLLREKRLIEETQRGLILKEKPNLDQKKIDDFKKQVEEVEAQVLALSGKSKDLIKQIRGEFETRSLSESKRH